MSLNICTLQGRLKEKPELRVTPSGAEVATARIAVTRDFKNKNGERETDWIPIVAFAGTAKFLDKYFEKGQMIVVTGRLQVRKYETANNEIRYATEVVADNVYFSGDKKQENATFEEPAFEGFAETNEVLPF